MEFIFMIFGLGFFIYVIWMVQIAEERMYQRKLTEQREFGSKNNGELRTESYDKK